MPSDFHSIADDTMRTPQQAGDDPVPEIRDDLETGVRAAGRAFETAKARTQAVLDDARGRASEGALALSHRVEENPLKAVGMALGAGILLGALLFARRETIYIRKA